MCTADFEKYVEFMCKSIDASVDPTVDFVKYACGNFRQEYFDVTQGNYLPTINADFERDVLLNETITYPSLVKARNYYKSHVKDFPGLLKNKQLTDICGTFPAFDDKWQSENFDWVKASAIYSCMYFGINMVYTCEIVDGHRVITIKAIRPDDVPVYDECETLRKIGLSEEKIPEIIADFNEIEAKLNSCITERRNYYHDIPKKTYAEIKEEKFDYCKFIEISKGETLREGDVFAIANFDLEYFNKYGNISEEAGPRVMANYITLKVASQMTKSQFGLAMVRRYFNPAIVAAGFSKFWNNEISERRKEVLAYLKKSFENMNDKFRKDLSMSRANISNEIMDKLIIEYVQVNFNQEQIEQDYKDVEIDPDDFVKNYFFLKKRGLTTPTKSVDIKSQIHINFHSKMIELLNFTIKHYNRPMSFYFSGWGLKMWYDYIFECRFRESSEEFKCIQKCMQKQIDDHGLTKVCFAYEYWIKHYITKLSALQMAYKNFSNWLAENKDQVKVEEEILQKFDLNCRKSFFIAFVQHACFDKGITLNPVILALINSQEFCDVFNCTNDSPMMEKEKYICSWE